MVGGNLALHDPFSCVDYAVEKYLTISLDWEYTREFINDTQEYPRLTNVIKTTKSMRSKCKFGVEIRRSVKHSLGHDGRNVNNL